MVDDRQEVIGNPRAAHALGLGMVYQHFTLVPAMTVAENFVLARDDVPAVVDWARERKTLEEFLARMPFRVPLNAKVSAISAGERQKCEILKQLYLRRRFLILDEPTSVLTPGEADEVLGMLRGMVAAGDLTVLMITHKFREVMAFADEVTILRRGKLAGQGLVKDLSPDAMARTMIGAEELTVQPPRTGEYGATRLDIEKLNALDDGGQPAVRDVSLSIRGGEIVGVAGVSGNGQRQLIEVLAGQRDAESGKIRLQGELYHATRAGDAPQSSLGASRGAAEERLRGAHERRRQSRLPRIRPRAVRVRRLVAQSARNSTKTRCARSSATRSRRARTTPRSANCPAATCSAPCWRASLAARSISWSPPIPASASTSRRWRKSMPRSWRRATAAPRCCW